MVLENILTKIILLHQKYWIDYFTVSFFHFDLLKIDFFNAVLFNTYNFIYKNNEELHSNEMFVEMFFI